MILEYTYRATYVDWCWKSFSWKVKTDFLFTKLGDFTIKTAISKSPEKKKNSYRFFTSSNCILINKYAFGGLIYFLFNSGLLSTQNILMKILGLWGFHIYGEWHRAYGCKKHLKHACSIIPPWWFTIAVSVMHLVFVAVFIVVVELCLKTFVVVILGIVFIVAVFATASVVTSIIVFLNITFWFFFFLAAKPVLIFLFKFRL